MSWQRVEIVPETPGKGNGLLPKQSETYHSLSECAESRYAQQLFGERYVKHRAYSGAGR
jgi:hypothetical protein